MNNPCRRLGAVTRNQFLQIQTVQILHGIIKESFRSVTVVIDLNGVGVRQLACQLDFALKSLQRKIIGLFWSQQFDGRFPPQQGVLGTIHSPHSTFAYLDFKMVLPKTFSLQLSFSQSLLPMNVQD